MRRIHRTRHSRGVQATLPEFCRSEPGARAFSREEGARGRIDVWLAHTGSAHDATLLQDCANLLDPLEIDACAAFHREADRQRALVSRALLRVTLSRYAPVHPKSWEFVPGAHGKPAIAGALGARLRFNLTHTCKLAACAVTLDDGIGIDLEDATRTLDPLELAERVFSTEEIIALRALEPELQRQRFLEIWTLKEAYLKARGVGFTLAPQSAAFKVGDGGHVRAQFAPEAGDDPAAWWFALLGTQPGHILALAARTVGRRTTVRTFLTAPGSTRAEQIAPRVYARCRHAGLARDPLLRMFESGGKDPRSRGRSSAAGIPGQD